VIPLRAALSDEEDTEPLDPETERREKREFRFRHLIAHLRGARDWQRLFELIEQRGFLADQADSFGGFGRPGEDVEEHVLTAAIEAGDWDRFVRFAAVAANLRALAEDLTDDEILTALSQGERDGLARDGLARDLAARLADPVRRAEARAVVAVACGPGHPAYGLLLREIAQDLQEPLDAERRVSPLSSLLAVARRLGPELDALWPVCLPQWTLTPDDSARVWQGVATGWLDRGDIQAPGLWRALAEIRNPRLLLEIAPEHLANLKPEDPWAILGKLRLLFESDEENRLRAFAAFLGSLARSLPGPVLAAWERWKEAEDIPWSAELIEACSGLITRLAPDRLETFYAEIGNPEARVALRVVVLEHRSDGDRAASALSAVGQIPGGPERLHWSLRYMEARPPEPREEVRNQVGAIAGYLYEVRYEAPAGDLRCFLDLVARFRPGELKPHLESVVWSPSGCADTLLTLACETGSEEVADLLLEGAERYAAAVSPTAAEGFQLRKELLIRVASRICLLRGSTRDLDRVVGRLLPEEEDDLRADLAPQLRSREIAEGIRDRRRRLLALLEVTPSAEAQGDLLTPRSLYASVARVNSLEDEIRGLSTLLEYPLDLSELAEKRVGAIRETGIRLQALLRLAWHSLTFQESFYGGRPDRAAAIEMVRSAFAADTDARLVAFTPQLTALGSQMGGTRAVAELQEAARRLVRLDSVPWQDRLEALERILASIPSIFLAPGDRRGARRAAEVLEAVARLPFQRDTGAALEEIRSRWHEALPIAAAVLDRLPEKVAPRVLDAFQTGLSFPATPVQMRIFELCLLKAEERLDEVDRRLGEPALDPEEVRALVYLVVVPAPERIPTVLELLPVSAERDDLGLRLIRNGWLIPEQIPALQPLFSTPEAWQRAEVWLSPERDAWCRSLAAMAARGEIDPASPADEPLVRRLWERSSPEMLPELAKAVREALRTGGRERGEAALRLWLHARLSPKLGAAQGEKARLAKGACSALQRALELAPATRQDG